MNAELNVALNVEGTMGEKFKASWKGPAEGRSDIRPGRWMEWRAEFTGDEGPAWRAAAPVLAWLLEHLGDHMVLFHAGEVRPEVWETDLPWRQARYGYDLKLPLSKLADPATWVRVVDGAGGRGISMWANRGAGASHQQIWSMEAHGPGPGLRLELSAKHAPSRPSSALRTLTTTFFSAIDGAQTLRGGFATAHDVPGQAGSAPRLEEPLVGLREAYVAEAYRRGALWHPGPRGVATFISGELVAKLGGKMRLVRSVREHLTPALSVWEFRQPEAIDGIVEFVSGGAIVWLAMADSWCPFTTGSMSGNPARISWWFCEELGRHGMLAQSQEGLLRAWVEHETARKRADDAGAKRAPIRLPSRPAPTEPPVCVHHGRPDPGVEVAGFRPGAQIAIYKLTNPGSTSEAMTLYGRARAGGDNLRSPVLAGSMDRDRASLYFDARIHGNDGAGREDVPEKARPMGTLAQHRCAVCDGRLFEAWAAFEYPEDWQDATPGAIAGPEQFTWIWVLTRCVACNAAGIALDEECG